MEKLSLVHRIYTVREQTPLTNSYYTTSTMDGRDCSKLVLYIDFIKENLTSADIRIFFSHDKNYWFQETTGVFATGTYTEYKTIHRFATTGTHRLVIPILDKWIRLEVVGNGDLSGNNSLYIYGYVGTN